MKFDALLTYDAPLFPLFLALLYWSVISRVSNFYIMVNFNCSDKLWSESEIEFVYGGSAGLTHAILREIG